MAKETKKAVERTRMSEAQLDQFEKRYMKECDLKPGKEITQRFREVAIKRLAALERQATRDAAKVKPKAAKKAAKK